MAKQNEDGSYLQNIYFLIKVSESMCKRWSDKPNNHDTHHLKKFIQKYPCASAFFVCQTPRKFNVSENITAIPWQQLYYISSQLIQRATGE